MYGTSPSAHRIGNAPHLHQAYDWGRRFRSLLGLERVEEGKGVNVGSGRCVGIGLETLLAFGECSQ